MWTLLYSVTPASMALPQYYLHVRGGVKYLPASTRVPVLPPVQHTLLDNHLPGPLLFFIPLSNLPYTCMAAA